jgi:hypothetical protein
MKRVARILTSTADRRCKLLLHPEHGYAIGRAKYDESGNMVEAAIYGVDGELMLHPKYEFAIKRREYDGGHLVKEAFCGPDEKLLLER